MKTCPRCDTPNDDSYKFCQQCGRALDVARVAEEGPPPKDATVRWTAQAGDAKTAARRAVSIDMLFAGKNRLVVGRAPDCDVRLAHPSISRYHALVDRLPQGIRLHDLGSVNGVTVGGRRITEPIYIRERELVGIGPFLFSMAGDVLYMLDNSRSLRLEAHHLEKVVRLATGEDRKLLDTVNLVVEPGEFVSLLGPSGSGKSTLMDCLNGRRRATGGKVLANGEDFYQHYDNFRQSLGYVPQKDIVHTQLTVQRALYYTARLRLPVDTDPAELNTRIDEVLEEMELVPHRETLVANLSGGQIKRVSLGAELLARPCLLYIDEATSGLDAGTEARMMRLFRRLADEGKSLICITHNVDNVDRCHLALVLVRGRLVYYGPPQDAPGYFGVRRLSEIYDRLGEREPEAWHEDFLQSDAYKEFVEKRLATASATPAVQFQQEVPFGTVIQPSLVDFMADLTPPEAEPASKSRLPLLADRIRQFAARYGRVRERLSPLFDSAHQLRVLTQRYIELVWSDRRSLAFLLLQAPIVAVFLLVGFAGKPYRQPMPILRHLDADEKRLLEAMNRLIAAANGKEKLDEAQMEALKQVQVKIKSTDGEKEINGAELLFLVGKLEQGPEGFVDPDQLRRVKIAVGEGEERTTITGEEIARAVRQLHEKKILDNLLALNERFPIIPEEQRTDPRFTYMLLNILAITVFWFGTNNASKEIVKEEAIYGRERAFNLHILPYLGSKFLVLSVISAIQVLLLMLVVFGMLELFHVAFDYSTPPPEYRLPYLPQYGMLTLLAICGVALGLLLSACVASPDRASALLPYVLIPQIILGGAIIAVRGQPLMTLAWTLSPVYWGYQGIHRGSNYLPLYHPMHMEHDFPLRLTCGALIVQTIVLLGVTAWFLRRKDVGRG